MSGKKPSVPAYHHAVGDDYIRLGTKKDISDRLKSLGVTRIKVQRGTTAHYFNSSSWCNRASASAPSLEELQAALKEEIPKHPDRQRTLLQKIFDVKEWQLLFTPPYTPEVQPIEKVWAL